MFLKGWGTIEAKWTHDVITTIVKYHGMELGWAMSMNVGEGEARQEASKRGANWVFEAASGDET